MLALVLILDDTVALGDCAADTLLELLMDTVADFDAEMLIDEVNDFVGVTDGVVCSDADVDHEGVLLGLLVSDGERVAVFEFDGDRVGDTEFVAVREGDSDLDDDNDLDGEAVARRRGFDAASQCPHTSARTKRKAKRRRMACWKTGLGGLGESAGWVGLVKPTRN